MFWYLQSGPPSTGCLLKLQNDEAHWRQHLKPVNEELAQRDWQRSRLSWGSWKVTRSPWVHTPSCPRWVNRAQVWLLILSLLYPFFLSFFLAFLFLCNSSQKQLKLNWKRASGALTQVTWQISDPWRELFLSMCHRKEHFPTGFVITPRNYEAWCWKQSQKKSKFPVRLRCSCLIRTLRLARKLLFVMLSLVTVPVTI